MALLLAGLALLWAAMLALGGGEADRAALLFLYAGGKPELIDAAVTVTQLGGYPALLAATFLGAVRLGLRRDWRAALLLLAITLSGRLLVALQKGWTGRPRPEVQDQLVAVQSWAFPSAHAANATMVFLTLALLLPRTARGRGWAVGAAAAIALAVGISRPMLGVHWPSDVVAGWAFGLAWTLLLFRLSGTPPTDCSPASPSRSPG
jgi:undecaprenyl-diphosphatase